MIARAALLVLLTVACGPTQSSTKMSPAEQRTYGAWQAAQTATVELAFTQPPPGPASPNTVWVGPIPPAQGEAKAVTWIAICRGYGRKEQVRPSSCKNIAGPAFRPNGDLAPMPPRPHQVQLDQSWSGQLFAIALRSDGRAVRSEAISFASVRAT
ncbi:MAG: hypothetical protein A3D26_02920 [Candidatus Blackburnbacteria bacterium RIFCSPHIGHO2_02_FULL_44_20]|uniref:Rieske domain-containing protein n=1 Tax=Candidatus Blackburnbacteria bacterium RIFCSPHIGHO2_02_FULL_44_20 TaxID=1797516 RepID=A0A1G1V5S4_9BACT|nr:MAG: hypothetical protein A3D26_02920 [Candidatus Blackburnbacteria bacterium RIFCSPHIGHO2_02_FULL_44_20]OGY11877.1 MAG: hypothetical protein A3E16_03750 [Candidatus Blackburnbacteria bacterium RIFCSPHIGHO2_12_FULL_44_25]